MSYVEILKKKIKILFSYFFYFTARHQYEILIDSKMTRVLILSLKIKVFFFFGVCVRVILQPTVSFLQKLIILLSKFYF